LIRVGLEFVVEENAVAPLTGLLWQRKCDQVSEATLGQRVLVGKEAVVRIEADVGPPLHRFRKIMELSLRASASSKKSHTCAPRPERERSKANGKVLRLQVSTKAAASSRQPSLSKSAAKKKHVSSCSIG
jgi:hypothetical protein